MHVAYCYNKTMTFRRTQLLVIIATAVFTSLFFLFNLDRHVTYEMLLKALESLKISLGSQPLLFIAVFFLFYVLVIASSVPIATALTLSGGALMGGLVAPLVIVPAATLGCVIPYFAARLLLRDYVRRRYKKTLTRVEKGIDDSGWWFLLSARLNPILPFVALNLVSGVANIPLRQYVSATFLGIIPGVIVSTYAGSQITQSIEDGTVIRPGVFIALLLLAVLPLLIRYLQKKLLTSKGIPRG